MQNDNIHAAQNAKAKSLCLIQSPYFLPSIMFVLCAIFYSYQYLLQVSPSVMTQDLMRDFGVNATTLGSLAACYFYAYAAMQIPVGLIFDRFCARRPLAIAAFICALGCLLFASTNHLPIAVLGRLLIGMGGAFTVVGSMYISAMWLPLRLFAFLVGVDVTIGMVGAIGGQAPLAFMVNRFNWHHTMSILAAAGFALAAVIWLVMRDLPKTNLLASNTKDSPIPPTLTATEELAPTKSKHSIIADLNCIIRNKQIWLIAIYGGLMFMPISVFGSLWGIPFIMHKYNISNTAAGSIISMLFVGMALGTPFFGWLSDHIRSRKTVLLISACGSLVCILGVIYLALPAYVTGLLLFLYCFFAGGSLVCFAAARESIPSNSTGTAMGFVNTLNMLGGAIVQPVAGWLLDVQWNGTMDNGVRVYTLTNFKIALLIIPICITASIFTLYFVQETHDGAKR